MFILTYAKSYYLCTDSFCDQLYHYISMYHIAACLLIRN